MTTPSHTIKTTCPYCGVGCGVLATVEADGGVSVKGDPDHPANYGRLCSKGSALAETVDLDGRLLYPSVNGEQAGWDEALNEVAGRFKDTIEKYGPDSVAFYVSGQLLTEDYYVANKLMKGFIGSGNIDTNSRLCMSSSVAGHKRAFGTDTVPGCYEDLEQADAIILTGSNLAWCHPVLYQRIVKAKKDRPSMKVIVIDPRKTSTCDIADLHLALNSGTDAYFFNGLLVWLHDHGWADEDYIEAHTEGFDQALSTARLYSPDVATVARHCGMTEAEVERAYIWFARNEKVVTVYSQGINQSSSGTDKVNSIINCHLLTGRIGLPGMGPFSVTGQPNAMGGREVGALSNQLMAHMEFDREDHLDILRDFWDTNAVATKPGLKAVDLFHAVEEGKVKALWIMATNPAVSVPDSNQVRRALEKCEFLVVSDCMAETDTTVFADVLLPATGWGEKDGTVTNSERRISRQRKFLKAEAEAKADWWILSQVAQKMGYAGFDYSNSHEIFSEYARLTGINNDKDRDLDLSGLQEISSESYASLEPVQWPVRQPGDGQERFFDDGRFYTASGRAHFLSITPRVPENPVNDEFPLILNTGRVRDHWHTMTRTAKSPRLSMHLFEPYIELHVKDADDAGIRMGDLVEVVSQWGRAVVRARQAKNPRPGHVFIPMHWNTQYASDGLVDALVNPVTDPVSGQPEFKHTPISIKSFRPAWHGFVLSREPIKLYGLKYWVKTRRNGLWHYEIAGDEHIDDWNAWARDRVDCLDPDAQWSEYFDKAQSRYRGSHVVDDRLESCVFIGPDIDLPERDWLISLFGSEALSIQERSRLLAGSPSADTPDPGPVVCSCFGVGRNTIIQSILDKGLKTTEEVGAMLQAGTNCGSCLPELKALLAEARRKNVA